MATDNELFLMLVPYIEQKMTDIGILCSVIQSYQQTVQGVNVDLADGNGAQCFLHKVSDKRYGWKKIDPVYQDGQPLNEEFEVFEKQDMETTFNAQTMVRQDPSDITSLTASDVLNEIAGILQGQESITYFNDQFKVGIERVIDLPQTYIIDDKDQYEAVPNLQFVLTHQRVRTHRAPQAKSKELKLYRV